MLTVYRAGRNVISLELKSNEQLGLIGSALVEDENGNDGFVTLHHVPTGQKFQIVMTVAPDITPTIPNDAVHGPLQISSMPNGEYEIRGRVRDKAGNSTVLTSMNPSVFDPSLWGASWQVDANTEPPSAITMDMRFTLLDNLPPVLKAQLVAAKKPVSLTVKAKAMTIILK